MAYKDFSAGTDGFSGANHAKTPELRLEIEGSRVDLPDASYVRDADMTREGVDLVLNGPEGKIVIEGYFAADPAPVLVAPDGTALTPQLVESFTHGNAQFAANATATDASPVGSVQEVTGNATVTHADGTKESVVIGTPIFEGDIVETDANGAVNIMFVDQTSFAVSEDARLAIDKYVFDPATQAGTTDFSILKGVFVFTSGLIGRDDPDDVKIETPAGSIGIRGTIIAGNVTSGEITVVEGAIVLHDLQGHEITLASQFETARFNSNGGGIEHMGQLSASDVSTRFSSVANVSPSLFSSVHDAAGETGNQNGGEGQTDGSTDSDSGDAPVDTGPSETAPADAATDGANAAPAMPAVPPPLAAANVFSSTSVFAPANVTFSPIAPPAGSPTTAGPILGPAANGVILGPPPGGTAALPPPPPPNTTFDPNLPPPPAGTTNHAPFFAPEAPSEFFIAAENMNWRYHFIAAFGDQDFLSGDTMTFRLTPGTITMLNSLTEDGAGPNPDLLLNGAGTGLDTVTGDEGMGWSFNSTNGELNFVMSTAFDATAVPPGPGGAFNVPLTVETIDSHGAVASGTFTFTAYDQTATITSAFGNFSQDAKVVVGVGAVALGTISGDNNIIIMGQNGNADTITIDNTSGGNTGSGNTINLGDGANNLILENDAFGNTVIGGQDNDTFTLRNVRVEAYGMQGDDRFVLDFANGPNIASDLQTAGSQTFIDGGDSEFNIGHVLRNTYGLDSYGMTGGQGDTLELLGGATLDFGTIITPNKITGIERLVMDSDASAQTVTLRYSDVLNLTDDHTGHTLVINLGAGDTLNLNGSAFNLANMNKVLDDVALDDGPSGSPDVKNFDVFTDGNVTLLIHSSGGGVVNMDGVATAI